MLIEELKGIYEEKLYGSGIIRMIIEGFKVLQKERIHNKRFMIYLLVYAFSTIHCYPYGKET